MSTLAFFVSVVLVQILISKQIKTNDIIDCSKHQDCNVICSEQNCTHSHIICPRNHECSVTCNHDSCHEATINATHSSFFNLYLHPDLQSNLTLHLPSSIHHPCTHIHPWQASAMDTTTDVHRVYGASDHTVTLYALNGFNDLIVSPQYHNHLHGVMNCDSDYTSSCEFSTESWSCFEDNHMCSKSAPNPHRRRLLQQEYTEIDGVWLDDNNISAVHGWDFQTLERITNGNYVYYGPFTETSTIDEYVIQRNFTCRRDSAVTLSFSQIFAETANTDWISARVGTESTKFEALQSASLDHWDSALNTYSTSQWFKEDHTVTLSSISKGQSFSVTFSITITEIGMDYIAVCCISLDCNAFPTKHPTQEPSQSPTTQEPSQSPTEQPTVQPSQQPTEQPSQQPTEQPTSEPTADPTVEPTTPTDMPSTSPTVEPTIATGTPSISPTDDPTLSPTLKPSKSPTDDPTLSPTLEPSVSPTKAPSVPTDTPTSSPTLDPTKPSMTPSTSPTLEPTVPTDTPTKVPSTSPTMEPTMEPTLEPTLDPSNTPTEPSKQPSVAPSLFPTSDPTEVPTAIPWICDEDCLGDVDDDIDTGIQIMVTYTFEDYIKYNLKNMQCFLYYMFEIWFEAIDVVFVMCDITIMDTEGGTEDDDEGLCAIGPCLWNTDDLNSRRRLLQQMHDGTTSMNIIAEDQIYNIINAFSLSAMENDFTNAFLDYFGVDMDVNILLTNGDADGDGDDDDNGDDVDGDDDEDEQQLFGSQLHFAWYIVIGIAVLLVCVIVLLVRYIKRNKTIERQLSEVPAAASGLDTPADYTSMDDQVPTLKEKVKSQSGIDTQTVEDEGELGDPFMPPPPAEAPVSNDAPPPPPPPQPDQIKTKGKRGLSLGGDGLEMVTTNAIYRYGKGNVHETPPESPLEDLPQQQQKKQPMDGIRSDDLDQRGYAYGSVPIGSGYGMQQQQPQQHRNTWGNYGNFYQNPEEMQQQQPAQQQQPMQQQQQQQQQQQGQFYSNSEENVQAQQYGTGTGSWPKYNAPGPMGGMVMMYPQQSPNFGYHQSLPGQIPQNAQAGIVPPNVMVPPDQLEAPPPEMDHDQFQYNQQQQQQQQRVPMGGNKSPDDDSSSGTGSSSTSGESDSDYETGKTPIATPYPDESDSKNSDGDVIHDMNTKRISAINMDLNETMGLKQPQDADTAQQPLNDDQWD